jgi:hypothetical protein
MRALVVLFIVVRWVVMHCDRLRVFRAATEPVNFAERVIRSRELVVVRSPYRLRPQAPAARRVAGMGLELLIVGRMLELVVAGHGCVVLAREST